MDLQMCASSVNALIASWLLFCLISPLCNAAEKSYRIPRGVNDPAYRQFEPLQFEAASIEDERADIPKPAEKPYHNVYQPSAVHSRTIPSKRTNPGVYAKPNVAKSVSEYHVEEEYKSYYGFSGSRENRQRESDVDRFSRHREEPRRTDEEITRKMNALDKFLSKDNDENTVESRNTIEDITQTSISEETRRVVRQVRRQRPGFFWTLARLTFETFNDTRSAIQQISNIINDNIEPDTVTRPSVVGNSIVATNGSTIADQSKLPSNVEGVNVTTTMRMTTSTTQAPFRLTRTSLQDLIRRNLRGLMRLFNVEWQDALNQSEVNVREFQGNLRNQVGKFLRDNPNAF